MGDDLVGVLGPGERVGAFVPPVDVGPDGGLEVFDAVEGAAADRLPGDDPEEDLSCSGCAESRSAASTGTAGLTFEATSRAPVEGSRTPVAAWCTWLTDDVSEGACPGAECCSRACGSAG